MSQGQDAYEERRRLELENHVLHEREKNASLKAQAEGAELLLLGFALLKGILTGEKGVVIRHSSLGDTTIRLEA